MSLPRQIIPGSTCMVTRRCANRQFFLKPSEIVEQIFLYCLAVAAARTGVLIHAVNVMSNHYHLIATDPFGRMPEFYGWVHEFVGRALNAHYGRWENFWSTAATSCLRLIDDDAILDKIVYTLANPVQAGLVSDGNDWPGIRLYEPTRREIKRPAFFRSNGPLPETVIFELTPPPLMTTANHSVFDRIREALSIREAQLREGMMRAGRRFLGKDAVCAQRITGRPAGDEPRRGLSPRIACRDKWRRIEALVRGKQFVPDYRDARRRWNAGARDVLFPHGTYLMVRRHGVAVAPA
jgi:putative transposase